LVRNILIDGNENIKAGSLGCIEEASILQSRETGEANRLAVVAWE